VPFTIEQAGKEAHSFLLYDHGLTIYNDTVVVTEATLAERRSELVAFLRASRQGWNENFRYPNAWALKLGKSRLRGNGRSFENELFFNLVRQPLIEHPDGVFSMTEDDIAKNIEALARIGIRAPREVFDTTLLAEI
jgi:NMT1/THI5 like